MGKRRRTRAQTTPVKVLSVVSGQIQKTVCGYAFSEGETMTVVVLDPPLCLEITKHNPQR